MKFVVDMPNLYWASDASAPSEHRTFYDNLIRVLIAQGAPVTLVAYKAIINDVENEGISDGVYFAYHASRPGKNTFCVKPSAVPGLWFVDAGGYSGWSAIANDVGLQQHSATFDQARARQVIGQVRERFLRTNTSRLPQASSDLAAALPEPGFVFYPLQMNNDAVLSLSPHLQSDVLGALRTLAEQTRQTVVVKRHPLCQSSVIADRLKELASSEFIVISEASVHDIIPRASAVVVTNSGVGLEALIHGKPVFALGKSEYAHIATRLNTLADLALAFGDQQSIMPSRRIAQLGFLLDEYLVPCDSYDAIAARVADDIGSVTLEAASAGDATAERTALGGGPTVLHAMTKQISESIEQLLRVMAVAPSDDIPPIADILVRAGRTRGNRDRIVKGADLTTARRIQRWLAQQTDLKEAERVARLILQRSDDDVDHLALAKALFAREMDGEGFDILLARAASPRASAEILTFLARKQLSQKPPALTQAEESARRAVAGDGNDSLALWVLARALHLQKRDGEALPLIVRAAELDAGNVQFESLKAKIEKAMS